MAEFEASIVAFDEHLEQLRAFYLDEEASVGGAANLGTLVTLAEEHEHFHEDASLIISWVNAGHMQQAKQFLDVELEGELVAMEQLLLLFEDDADRRLLLATDAFDETVHQVEAGIAQLRHITIALIILRTSTALRTVL